jgi:tRNA U54 and U55 pseudouridine synthase Pus10
VVILTEVLPDSSNTHLQPFVQQIVDSINGKKIRLLQDVYDALNGDSAEEGREDYHVVRLLGEGRPLVLKRDTAEEAHERIMSKYNVSVDHFIEEPEILELEGVGIFEESDEAAESDDVETDDANEAA